MIITKKIKNYSRSTHLKGSEPKNGQLVVEL
jgi:hypothetical protein